VGGKKLRIAVIGAGASGIAATIKLKEADVGEVVVFEKANDVGGTWRDNTYPGVGCDVPSHLYRYSFAPKSDWTTEYAPGSEIFDYFKTVAKDYGVLDNVVFSSEVKSAEYADGRWHIHTSLGDQGWFDIVISAMGVLHREVYPDIDGREEFEGISFHSSKWDHSVSLKGKRVGIIGSGSTAVQILPAIVDEVADVSLFQRTPQWVVDVENKPISEEKKAAYKSDPSKMQDLYDFLADLLNDKFAAALVGENDEGLAEISETCKSNLENNIHDPDLRARLRPDYDVGCKRLVVSNKFYPAIQKSNAHLVDAGIDKIEKTGIRSKDGKLHELDVLIYATGFDPFNFFKPMKVIGREGKDLGEIWAQSSKALRSVTVPDFPNFFFLGGPNSPIGNFSFVMTAEAQLGYVVKLVKLLSEGQFREIEPTVEATDAFNTAIDAAMPKTIWVTGGCQSWYFDKSGKVASWPWTYEKFQEDLRTPNLEEFRQI